MAHAEKDSVLEYYLKELSGSHPLTGEQECRLTVLMKEGDLSARDQLAQPCRATTQRDRNVSSSGDDLTISGLLLLSFQQLNHFFSELAPDSVEPDCTAEIVVRPVGANFLPLFKVFLPVWK